MSIGFYNTSRKSMSPLFSSKKFFLVPDLNRKYKQNSDLAIQPTNTPNNIVLKIM